MKKIYKSLIALIIILCLLVCVGSVYAIDETLEELPTSEWGEIWQTEIKPLLYVGVASGSGSILGLIGFLLNAWKNRKANALQKEKETAFIENLCNKLGLTQSQIDLVKGNYENILNKVDDLVDTKIQPYMEKTEKVYEEILHLTEEYKEFKAFVTDTVKQGNVNDDRILKKLDILFNGIPSLVSGGFTSAAKKV
jgi:hypothetical protein